MSSLRPEDELPEPPALRLLRRLVTVLMVVMIGAVVAMTALLWHGYSNARAPLPERIALPDGTTATAFTQGPDWYAVVTADDRILIFDRAAGTLRQSIAILPQATGADPASP
ncbi:DUF6476 family protein [Citreimonas sp.]|uniref:DUF6476 family protein n=1 Tax=Citreimonas sp. TaxID=3036715 RepID=UPI004057D98D